MEPALSPLTERQREVLALANAGLANSEIARELGISQNAVRFHLKEIHSKLETDGARERLRGPGPVGSWRRWVFLHLGFTNLLNVGATGVLVGIAGIAAVLAYDGAPSRRPVNSPVETTTYHAWPGATLASFVVPGRTSIETLEALNPNLAGNALTEESVVVVPVLPGSQVIHLVATPGH